MANIPKCETYQSLLDGLILVSEHIKLRTHDHHWQEDGVYLAFVLRGGDALRETRLERLDKGA